MGQVSFPAIPKLFLTSGSDIKEHCSLICYRSCRRKRREQVEIQKALRTAPLRNRRIIQSLSASTGKPRSKLQYTETKDIAFRYSSTLKQTLTSKNKISRLNFCLPFVEVALECERLVHFDEKIVLID